MERFGIFGFPITHSLSPVMHTASFRSLGLDAEYIAFEVTPEALARTLKACQAEGFCGLNMTIPHKTAVIPLIDRVDPVAALAGAVNTVRFDADGKTSGFNTDIGGFLTDLKESCGCAPEGKRILLVGCGGAGRAIALGCVRAGAATVFLANRTEARAHEVAALLKPVATRTAVEVLPSDPAYWCSTARTCDVIINGTSAGLHAEDVSPLPAAAFCPNQVVYDLVYSPTRSTPFLRCAWAQGARGVDGLGMLIHQGAEAFRIWTGRDADIAAMRAAVWKEK